MVTVFSTRAIAEVTGFWLGYTFSVCVLQLNFGYQCKGYAGMWSLLFPVMDRMCCSGSTASTVLESSMVAGVETGQMFYADCNNIIF
jgi:hypothetical protein